jgi:Transcriptional regulators
MDKVTSKDVAKLAGVSQSTVSLILNNNKKIFFSDETKERVYAAALQLNYHLPARSTEELDESCRKLIFVLMPTLANQYYSELTYSIEQYADTCGYHVIFCNTFRKAELEKYYLDICTTVKAEGIIYTFLPSFPRMVEQMSKKTPVVLIGEKGEDLAISSIELSNVKAGSLVIEHLVKLGHQNFAYISTPMNNLTLARHQRLDGIRAKLKEYGMEDGIEVMVSDDGAEYDQNLHPFEYETGYSLTTKMLKGDCKATAFIGANDMIATGIIMAIRDSGRSVPKDYSVCGFDNIFFSSIYLPTLTTVDHHLNIRAKVAVDMILSKINPDGKEQRGMGDTTAVSKIEYAPQLIVRQSTGPR